MILEGLDSIPNAGKRLSQRSREPQSMCTAETNGLDVIEDVWEVCGCVCCHVC